MGLHILAGCNCCFCFCSAFSPSSHLILSSVRFAGRLLDSLSINKATHGLNLRRRFQKPGIILLPAAKTLEPTDLMAAITSQASLLLQKQLKDLMKHPVDGFSAGLVDDCNVFKWQVTIIGPPDTLYDGGYFNAIMSFPQNYPNSPPTVRFTSEMWHPNVYPDGRVCISILHSPGEDPNGYELASERWTPVHTVESIVLSIISMLSSPNDESPANIEAAKEWRENRDDFKKKVRRLVRKSQEML
ncbi:hypothetical protein GUJ93_ZPchr0001g32935 [Zizania palustris]|uniref:E2 ubiquitin-conjugating enzyme n=1 Tax=Zizania palustris TaxID=103762 RepID=A0A8J5SFV4_ZIZPA|nr:hypothetical protein GUJ93_ZPchr0001g32935 [Zizania palustris]